MTSEIVISVASGAFGILGTGLAVACYLASKRNRELLEFLAKQNDDLDASLSIARKNFEEGSHRLADNARRIAWLETRFRKGSVLKSETATVLPIVERKSATPSDFLKLNMTERRHRVLTLASRGQNAAKIASTLGMMPGEVELIINLNRVATM